MSDIPKSAVTTAVPQPGNPPAEQPSNSATQQPINKGFWDGGAQGHGTNKESSGRPDGFPGKRSKSRTGFRTDIEFPQESDNAQPKK
ncbi:MAG TPA: hypothetical protein VHX14_00115 [Thermoanaerobaculia bacterium]|jgi:hypothetical protein|nr:hypothetical protein [Thermoanaerobaculia bacterium]